MDLTCTAHDELLVDDACVIDQGPGAANAAVAALGDVRPLACFARMPAGAIVGGAVGRTWGECCELQQLWVAPECRRQGIATRLVRAFEQHAAARGCRRCYLDTFSFQAPAFYRALGYEARLEIRGYAAGIVRHTMVREFPECGAGTVAPPSC